MANRNNELAAYFGSLLFVLLLVEMEKMSPAERPSLSEVRQRADATGQEMNRLCETYPTRLPNYYSKVKRGERDYVFAYARAILAYDPEIIARVPNNGPLVAALAARKRNAWILRILRTVFVISGLLIGAYICAAGQGFSSGAGLSDLSSETQSVRMPSETQSTPMPLTTETEVDGAGLSDLSSKTQTVPMPSETQPTPMPPPSEAKADPPLVETEPPASSDPVDGGSDAGLAMMREVMARIESTNDRTQERIESISTNTIDKLVEVFRIGSEQHAR